MIYHLKSRVESGNPSLHGGTILPREKCLCIDSKKKKKKPCGMAIASFSSLFSREPRDRDGALRGPSFP